MHVMGMEGKRHFSEVYADNGNILDPRVLEREVREATEQLMEEKPGIGSIVLECTNLAPFSPLVRQVSGRPVFGMDDLLRFIHRCVS